jgi:hypothetical protein
MTENEANAASETSPLLFSNRPDPAIPAENHAYMSPMRLNAPRTARTPTPRAQNYKTFYGRNLWP